MDNWSCGVENRSENGDDSLDAPVVHSDRAARSAGLSTSPSQGGQQCSSVLRAACERGIRLGAQGDLDQPHQGSGGTAGVDHIG